MERVQFQQEQMLTELKDLVQKGLFTQKEVKQIMQKRTVFETALVRRIPKKSDFLRYATYEMGLEALRRKRAEHLNIAKGPPSVSDYALVRRQFQIFERALRKFKGDVGLWLQYIQTAKKEGARSLVGRITARALQLHPNVPALYVLAASHELEHLSPTAARVLLQRGIRLNADSIEMWREYVRMEMGFVESLRRRWSVLGINVKGKGKEDASAGIGKDKGRAGGMDEFWNGVGEEGEDAMQVNVEDELPEDEAARREIMEGAIVKSVISSAVKAIPKIGLFNSLHELISAYPSPPTLRESLLDHLHGLLHETLPSLPAAIKLSATRHLTPELVGEPLVDALKSANEQLFETVRSPVGQGNPGIANVYAEFVEEWCGKNIDNSLKAYLITSIHLLIQQVPAPVPPGLLATHVRLLVSHLASFGSALLPRKVNTPEKVLRVARKHTSIAPASAPVWLARLSAEKQFSEQGDITRAWEEARKNVEGEGIQDVWLWGLDHKARSPPSSPTEEDMEADAKATLQLLEHLLHESLLIRVPAAAGALHEVLLMRYAVASHRALFYRSRAMRKTRHASTSAIANVAPGAAARSSSKPSRAQREGAHAQGQASDDEDSIPVSGTKGDPAVDGTGMGGVAAILGARLSRVRQIGTAYVPSARVWTQVFEQEASFHSGDTPTSAVAVGAAADEKTKNKVRDHVVDGDAQVLRTVYEFWRQRDGVEATIAWATWLLRSGNGREAVAVVARARSVLGPDAGEQIERRWRTILDGPAAGGLGGGAGVEGEGDDKSTLDAAAMDEA